MRWADYPGRLHRRTDAIDMPEEQKRDMHARKGYWRWLRLGGFYRAPYAQSAPTSPEWGRSEIRLQVGARGSDPDYVPWFWLGVAAGADFGGCGDRSGCAEIGQIRPRPEIAFSAQLPARKAEHRRSLSRSPECMSAGGFSSERRFGHLGRGRPPCRDLR